MWFCWEAGSGWLLQGRRQKAVGVPAVPPPDQVWFSSQNPEVCLWPEGHWGQGCVWPAHLAFPEYPACWVGWGWRGCWGQAYRTLGTLLTPCPPFHQNLFSAQDRSYLLVLPGMNPLRRKQLHLLPGSLWVLEGPVNESPWSTVTFYSIYINQLTFQL